MLVAAPAVALSCRTEADNPAQRRDRRRRTVSQQSGVTASGRALGDNGCVAGSGGGVGSCSDSTDGGEALGSTGS